MDRLKHLVKAAIDGGVNGIQIREKDLSPRTLRQTTRALREITDRRAILTLNVQTLEQLEIGLECTVDAIHIGESALPIPEVRTRLRESGLLIGASVHSLEAANIAVHSGADFLQIGTLFSSESHPELTNPNPAIVREIRNKTAIPLIGVGGITKANAGAVINDGADGVAVIRGISHAANPKIAAEALCKVVKSAYEQKRLLNTGKIHPK